MTLNERRVLLFLSDKMEASSESIGHNLHGKYCSYSTRSAAALLGFLRESGYVTRISELKAWSITRKGREMLEREKQGDYDV